MFVCLSVCLFVPPHIQLKKPRSRTSPKFCACCLWPWLGPRLMALYFRFFRMTLCFHTMGLVGRIKHDVTFKRVRQVAVPVGRHTQLQCSVEFVRVWQPGAKSALPIALFVKKLFSMNQKSFRKRSTKFTAAKLSLHVAPTTLATF